MSLRSSMISPAFATVDARTCSSSADTLAVPEYRNGYSDSTEPGRPWLSCCTLGHLLTTAMASLA